VRQYSVGVTPSPLTLADIHLDLLYVCDASGLILTSRDPSVTAPLFHLIRTPAGNRWLLSAALSAAERHTINAALAAEPVLDSLGAIESHPPLLTGVRALLASRGASTETRGPGPAFAFPDLLPQPTANTEILRDPATTTTVPDLAWLRGTAPHEHPLAVARNSSGEVVAICHSARSTPGAAEAGVETAGDYRGRGLAGAVVISWATAVRGEGRIPIYSTQWTNLASRAVARKLGLITFGEDVHIP
jgi:hypothetical protein